MTCCSIGPCTGAFTARFMQLDTVATASDPGYDNILTEPKLVKANVDDPLGTVGREEIQYDILAQIEHKRTDRLRQVNQGKVQGAEVEVIASRHDFEIAGLLDANGHSKIRTGARLDRILDRSGNLIQAYPNPPGMFVDEITYDSWTDREFALIIFTLSPRDRAK